MPLAPCLHARPPRFQPFPVEKSHSFQVAPGGALRPTGSFCPLPITEPAVAGSGTGAPLSGLVTNLDLEQGQGPFSAPISMDEGGATVGGDRTRILAFCRDLLKAIVWLPIWGAEGL